MVRFIIPVRYLKFHAKTAILRRLKIVYKLTSWAVDPSARARVFKVITMFKKYSNVAPICRGWMMLGLEVS